MPFLTGQFMAIVLFCGACNMSCSAFMSTSKLQNSLNAEKTLFQIVLTMNEILPFCEELCIVVSYGLVHAYCVNLTKTRCKVTDTYG